MRLVPNRLRLVSVRTVQKENKSFSFMRFANTQTFESNDFVASRDLDVSKYPAGFDYDVVFNIDGKYLSVIEINSISGSKGS